MSEDRDEILGQEVNALQHALTVIWRWIKRAVYGMLLLFLFLNLLLQIPAIQNWAAKEVTATLQKRLQTDVSIDYLYLAFFDKLVLEGFYVEDYFQDTLIYSRKLKVDINTNPIVFYRRGLEIEEIGLSETQVNLRRAKGEYQTNFEIMLSRLFTPGPAKTGKDDKKAFRMNIRKIDLDRVLFLQDDQVKGKKLSVFLTRGSVILNTFDIPNKKIHASEVRLQKPIVGLDDLPENPLPPFEEMFPSVNVDSMSAAADTTHLDLSIDEFFLSDGKFALHNYRVEPVDQTPPDMINYRHLEVFDINLEVDSFAYRQEVFKGQLQHLNLEESSGFVLDKLASDQVSVSSEEVELYGLNIQTPYSQIGDTLIFKYQNYIDFTEFPEEVRMDIHLNNAAVALQDIMVFAPGLRENNFFKSNREKVLTIDGLVQGRVNNLRGRDLNIVLADGSTIEGSFSSRNIAVRNEEFLNLRLERLRTSMRTLRQLLPRFNPPNNFDKLGRIDFSGSFDGFFADFVADGVLRTDIGRAEMDMRMNLKEGREKANYSGELSLINFDLGKWSDNDDFGIVNFTSEVKNGIGLAGDNATAELTANIQSFGFKGYNYENAIIEGALNKYLFNGFFEIQDENIDFSFRGELDYTDSIPTFDFDANVNKLYLQKLNLSQKDLALAGNIDLNLKNDEFSSMEGEAAIRNFRIIEAGDEYFIDSIYASSTFDREGIKTFYVNSDLMKAEIRGEFDIEQIPNAFLDFGNRNYPEFASRFGVKDSIKYIQEQSFTYDIEIRSSKGLNNLIDEKLGLLENIKLSGYFDNQRDSLLIDLEAPHFQYDNLELADVVLLVDAVDDAGGMDLAVDSTIINNKTVLSTITLLSIFERDTLTFGVNYSSANPGFLDNLSLNGAFFLHDSTNFQIRFDQSNLVIMESPWIIDEDNYITFGKNYIDTENFVLTNQEKKIILERIRNKGLRLSLNNFDFSFIDDYWDYEPLDFGGRFNVNAEVGNIFEQENIYAVVVADTFLVNDDDWGALRMDIEAKSLKSPFNTHLSITKDTVQILAEGFYNPPNIDPAIVKKPASEKQPNYFDGTLDISGFPLNIAEYWIGDNVSGTVGSFNGNLRIYGEPTSPNISGYLVARDGGVTIDFLKTRYTFRESYISVNNYMFDATGTTLTDKFNNTAVLYGGVSHTHLKDLGFDARLRTQRFLALDTKKGDNDLFYGRAMGRGEITFSGSFQQPNIYVNAEADDGTKITIPISTSNETSELNFIRFVEKHKEIKTVDETTDQDEAGGVSLEMDLVVNEEADMELVFDEQAGDIIRGNGRGNIRILVPRQGDFQMFGDYVIEEGNYLFTLYNVVNKDFRVKNGSIVQWTGDPYAAQIQLEAEYKDLKTPILPFIGEYMQTADQNIQNQAAQGTNVDLTLILTGELLEPTIRFDLDFPNLTGQLQTYADSKLRILRQDQNEMNRQVFGLIVVGQFLPSDLSFTGSDLLYNTVSEFVSNQLSLLITELFSEVIADGNVLSGIDFDVAYNQYQSVQLGDGQDFSGGEEFQVRLKQNFFNDRLSILVGGNIDFNNNLTTAPEAAGAFVGNDLVIEYVLNRDRTLKFRIYQRLSPDIGGGSRFEVGTGLSFRREFNSFGEFIRNLRKDGKKMREKDKENQ